jgi:branched-chain amino acid transport system ATP-binding protein
MKQVLETRELSVSYGGNLALGGVSIHVDEGELVGLIGPNGAGKTTFIDALTGFAKSTGSVKLEGQNMTGARPHQRARRGLGRSWQGAELYDDLTVRENLEVGAHHPSVGQSVLEVFAGRTESLPSIERASSLLGLDSILGMNPEDLSQGQRKSVDVARALTAGSRVLCLDEPAAGLDSDESSELGKSLKDIVAAGTSLLLVDHDMGLVLGICDRIYVLDLGKVIAEGTPAEIRTSSAVIDAYLGQEQATVEMEEDR